MARESARNQRGCVVKMKRTCARTLQSRLVALTIMAAFGNVSWTFSIEVPHVPLAHYDNGTTTIGTCAIASSDNGA